MAVDAKRWDRQYADHDPPTFEDPSPRVAEEVLHLPPATALDVAGGRGRHAIPLAARGWDVTAVDFSGMALRQGRQLAAERGVSVRWVQADVEAWQPPLRAFALVLVAYLQVENTVLAGVLARAAAAVASGGRLVAVGYDLANRGRDQAGPPEPSRLYSVPVVTGAVHGLVVARAEQVERTVRRSNGDTVTVVDTVVRAVRPADG